jgi:hypothetical protein
MSKTAINSIYPVFSKEETDILKGLANKVAGFAAREGEKEKAKLWTAEEIKNDSLEGLILPWNCPVMSRILL